MELRGAGQKGNLKKKCVRKWRAHSAGTVEERGRDDRMLVTVIPGEMFTP